MCLGIPGRIVAIVDASRDLATVEVAGVRREVNISCILDGLTAQDCVGEWVLVHVGFAMARIDAEEAARTLALLEAVHDLGEDEVS